MTNDRSGEGETVEGGLLGLANRFTPLQEGWIQLAPLGDHPKDAVISGRKETVIQRLDGESVRLMIGDFDQIKRKLGDKFGGLPFYEGHPDVPGMSNVFKDRRAYGWIEELRPGASGLDARVKWSETADAWIKEGHFKFYSPYWLAVPLGNASPGSLNGARIFRPVRLISAGLTNDPNIAVLPLSNTSETTTITTVHLSMNPRDILCKLLGLANTPTDEQITASLAVSLGLANTATLDQVNAAIGACTTLTALANARTTAETSLSNVTRERDSNAALLLTANSHLATERTALANVRKEFATTLVDAAIAGGRLTGAEKDVTLAGFTTDFANSRTALEARPKTVKTTSTTGNLHERKVVAFDNARDRQAEVQRLVREETDRLEAKGTQDAYGQAFANVERDHAELFAPMTPTYLKEKVAAA